MTRTIGGALLGVALLCLPSLARAQALALDIHGHPQKLVYLSPAEWPTLDFQCHWAPQENPLDGNVDGVNPPTLGHIHFAWTHPAYAVLTSTTPINTSFQVKMFRWNGRIFPGGIGGHGIRNVRFDGPAVVLDMDGVTVLRSEPPTGTDVPPIQEGDPDHLVVENGTLTIDPGQFDGWDGTPLHGWAEFWAQVGAATFNGSYLGTQAQISLWSEIDPSAPITGNSEGGYPHEEVKCQNFPRTGQPFGATITDLLSPIPLAPLTAPWPQAIAQYAYGGDSTPLQFAQHLREYSLDPNLHMGNEGKQIFQQSGIGIQPLPNFPDNPYWVNPKDTGEGAHTIMYSWKIDGGVEDFPANETIWSVLSVPIEVAPGASIIIPGPPPPPPPPPPVAPPVTFTSDKATIALGESYTLTAVIDESKGTVHNIFVDGISWASLGCQVVMPMVTCTLVRTPTAKGTVTDTFNAFNLATGGSFLPLTVTVNVQ